MLTGAEWDVDNHNSNAPARPLSSIDDPASSRNLGYGQRERRKVVLVDGWRSDGDRLARQLIEPALPYDVIGLTREQVRSDSQSPPLSSPQEDAAAQMNNIRVFSSGNPVTVLSHAQLRRSAAEVEDAISTVISENTRVSATRERFALVGDGWSKIQEHNFPGRDGRPHVDPHRGTDAPKSGTSGAGGRPASSSSADALFDIHRSWDLAKPDIAPPLRRPALQSAHQHLGQARTQHQGPSAPSPTHGSRVRPSVITVGSTSGGQSSVVVAAAATPHRELFGMLVSRIQSISDREAASRATRPTRPGSARGTGEPASSRLDLEWLGPSLPTERSQLAAGVRFGGPRKGERPAEAEAPAQTQADSPAVDEPDTSRAAGKDTHSQARVSTEARTQRQAAARRFANALLRMSDTLFAAPPRASEAGGDSTEGQAGEPLKVRVIADDVLLAGRARGRRVVWIDRWGRDTGASAGRVLVLGGRGAGISAAGIRGPSSGATDEWLAPPSTLASTLAPTNGTNGGLVVRGGIADAPAGEDAAVFAAAQRDGQAANGTAPADSSAPLRIGPADMAALIRAAGGARTALVISRELCQDGACGVGIYSSCSSRHLSIVNAHTRSPHVHAPCRSPVRVDGSARDCRCTPRGPVAISGSEGGSCVCRRARAPAWLGRVVSGHPAPTS